MAKPANLPSVRCRGESDVARPRDGPDVIPPSNPRPAQLRLEGRRTHRARRRLRSLTLKSRSMLQLLVPTPIASELLIVSRCAWRDIERSGDLVVPSPDMRRIYGDEFTPKFASLEQMIGRRHALQGASPPTCTGRRPAPPSRMTSSPLQKTSSRPSSPPRGHRPIDAAVQLALIAPTTRLGDHGVNGPTDQSLSRVGCRNTEAPRSPKPARNTAGRRGRHRSYRAEEG